MAGNHAPRHALLPLYCRCFAAILALLAGQVCAAEFSWGRLFGGAADDYLHAMAQHVDGGVLLAGSSVDARSGLPHGWLLHVDRRGEALREQRFQHRVGALSDIAALPNGEMILVGWTRGAHQSKREDGWIIKLDRHGGIIWDIAVGQAGDDRLAAVAALPHHGLVAVGRSQLAAGGWEGWAIGLTAHGVQVWERRYGASSGQGLLSVAVMPDGDLVMGGWSQRQGRQGAWIQRTDARGAARWPQWQRHWEGEGDDEILNVMPVAPNSIIATGSIWSSRAKAPQGLILSLTGEGEVQWYDTPGAARLYQASRLWDGSLMAVGSRVEPRQADDEGWLAHYSRDGVRLAETTVGGPKADGLHRMLVGDDGQVLLAGVTNSFGKGSRDGWLLAVQADGAAAAPCRQGLLPPPLQLIPLDSWRQDAADPVREQRSLEWLAKAMTLPKVIAASEAAYAFLTPALRATAFQLSPFQPYLELVRRQGLVKIMDARHPWEQVGWVRSSDVRPWPSRQGLALKRDVFLLKSDITVFAWEDLSRLKRYLATDDKQRYGPIYQVTLTQNGVLLPYPVLDAADAYNRAQDRVKAFKVLAPLRPAGPAKSAAGAGRSADLEPGPILAFHPVREPQGRLRTHHAWQTRAVWILGHEHAYEEVLLMDQPALAFLLEIMNAMSDSRLSSDTRMAQIQRRFRQAIGEETPRHVSLQETLAEKFALRVSPRLAISLDEIDHMPPRDRQLFQHRLRKAYHRLRDFFAARCADFEQVPLQWMPSYYLP